MATTFTRVAAVEQDGPFVLFQWTALADGETGDALTWQFYSDRSVQIGGSFGTSGAVVIEGSNDGANYRTLSDPQGNALSFTAAGLKQVLELTRFIRPRISAGTGTAITVHLFGKRST